MDTRQLWESKKGLALIIGIASILVLSVLAIIFHAQVQDAINSIVFIFSGHAAAQGATDFKNAGGNSNDDAKVIPATYNKEIASFKMKVTHYGETNDKYGDTLTREGMGNVENHLTLDACALTKSAQQKLGANEFDWIQIDFGNGTVIRKQFQDRCPNKEDRVDIYNPHNLRLGYPDFAEISLAS